MPKKLRRLEWNMDRNKFVLWYVPMSTSVSVSVSVSGLVFVFAIVILVFFFLQKQFFYFIQVPLLYCIHHWKIYRHTQTHVVIYWSQWKMLDPCKTNFKAKQVEDENENKHWITRKTHFHCQCKHFW